MLFGLPWFLTLIPSFALFVFGMHLMGSKFPAFKDKYSVTRHGTANSDYPIIRFFWIAGNSLLTVVLSAFWPIGLLVATAIIVFGKGAGQKSARALEKQLAKADSRISELETEVKTKNELIQDMVSTWKPPQT